MTNASGRSTRGAALALVVTGLLTVALSFATWGACPSTPCGGPFFAFSAYSGIDLGFGVVTAVAGIGLLAIGLDGLRRRRSARPATIAVLLALLIAATAGVSITWMHVLPGDDDGFYAPLGMSYLVAKDFSWPPFVAIVVGVDRPCSRRGQPVDAADVALSRPNRAW